ncbi:FAD-dependent oxidoreductase [Polynucleobacter necessarius]|uniref:FAD-dependent oxidoreductase n=1 Tax=Polynucleobacter necessarius TaxID=576610 RepID=UPI000E08F3E3|nr:FAD-dependent oxidoreductase [Polynucleobacter necessarius]HAT39089.1 hypothetical protein [Polynucleobacter sp.]
MDASRLKKNRVAVIGCGIFGTEIAIALSQSGFSVSIIESKSQILGGATGNNLNRLHIGFHYPRDLETAKQAYQCYEEFRKKYSSCVSTDFLNSYFIANEGSLTSPQHFFEFCRELGAPYEIINSTEFPLQIIGADKGIICEESVYDFESMRNLIYERFKENQMQLIIGNRVDRLSKVDNSYILELSNSEILNADVVINTTYADINRLTIQCGFELDEMQYEYTVIPIIEAEIPRVGVTIMDGPFTSILPRGSSGEFLLYHVDHSVLAREVGCQVNANWLSPETGPFFSVNKQEYFLKMIELCSKFIPALKSAKVCGYLEGPRIVQSKKESTDARPSVVKFSNDNSYISILSGKVDSSIWVARNIRDRLLGESS